MLSTFGMPIGEPEQSGSGSTHHIRKTICAQERAVAFDPRARLAIGTEAVLERHVRPPHEPIRADPLSHLTQCWPELSIRVAEKVAQPHGKADFEPQSRILPRLPDLIGE